MGHFRKTAIATGLLALGMNSLFAAGTLNVFDASTSEGVAATQVQGGTVVGTVKYNSGIKDGVDDQSSLTLNLDFLNESLQLDVVSVDKDGGGIAYSAISSSTGDILTVAENNGAMLGSLTHGNKVYKFEPAGNGDTLIVEMGDVADKTVAAPVSASGSGASLSGEQSASAGCNDDGKKIDVVVAYTPEFVEEVGGAGNVDAYMSQLEQETNLSFQLSGVNTKVDIVGTLASAKADSTNFKKDWNYYKTDGFGSGKALRDLRDSKYADIMVVLTGNMGYDACGMAPVKADSDNALAIIREGCGTGYYQFAHDIGHIFGTNHNIDTTQAPGTNEDYAHGYCGSGWRSIMSFNCASGGGKRKPIWSNPGNTFNGEATGVAGESNNVKVLNDNAKRVDDFMCAPPVPEKVAGLEPSATDANNGLVSNAVPFRYKWEPSPSTTQYIIKVTDSTGHVFEKTYSASGANCSDDGCSVLNEEMPADGIVKWTVIPKNKDGLAGPISDEATFTVTPLPVLPGSAELITPEGVISDSTPTYTWKAVPGTSKYGLWVGDNYSSVIYKWYTAAEVNCPSGTGTCSVTPDTVIAQSPTTWWVRTENDAGFGPWSAPNTFRLLQ